MSCANEKCKQRFKGVENFLRKVAFNLGNTPSQTEVKIISCIPIDVTDLQQKIISLEKELDAVKASKPEPVAKTIACCPNAANALHIYCQPNAAQTVRIEQSEGAYMKRSETENSLSTQPFSLKNSNSACPCCTDGINATYGDNQQIETETQCQMQGAIKKGKLKNVLKRKGKYKTHLVYYAQTESGPFATYQNQTRATDKTGSRAPNEDISRNYISEVIQKQYAAVPIAEEFPVCDQISSPVCRDLDSEPDRQCNNNCDTDLCSCLHGAFQNIDQSPNRVHIDPIPTCFYNNDANTSDFYDTSLYDMVPVKEKPAKSTTREAAKRKLHIGDMDAMSGKYRQKYRYHPFAVNYSKISPMPVVYPKKLPVNIINKKERQGKDLSKREEVMRQLERNQECIKKCSIDCGNVYVKRIDGKIKQPTINPIVSITHKNAECLTNNVKESECQTTTSQSVQIDKDLFQDDKKTEDALNQIKSILQSVLTEVKTNSQGKKVVDEKSTKDAIVQKGMSQGMMPGCSSMLNSYTYSPYNMNPYVASCSPQVNPGAACCLNLPYVSGKYMHNFPVFIQSPMRDMCSCYRNSSKAAKDMRLKLAATTATNTEAKERSEETQKLIQEIYKSVKLNMGMLTKDTSASENDGITPTSRQSFNKSVDVATVREEGIKTFVKSNADPKTPSKETAATPLMNENNKMTSYTTSLQSQMMSTTDTERYLRKNRIENYLKNLETQKVNPNRIVEEYDAPSPGTSEESSEEERSEDDEVTSIKELNKTPQKGGLFRKMFNGSFKMFKSKPKKKEEEIQVENEIEDEESEGESDDYQTIYSQKEVDRVQKHHVAYPARNLVKGKSHSKISFSKHQRNQERQWRSPYMEQEYRRHWNEKFMSHENQHRHSSESPPSVQNDRRRPNPIYSRDYQAMSAQVGHSRNRSVDASINQSAPMYIQTKNRGVTLRIPRKTGPKTPIKGLTWLKKHKPACGEQWKKIVLEG
ncbi:hypothetical protein evm_012025 [Chilo suppressalis]|nr:hypothetical protein evm_012025 [Chilo suppressalis]